MSNRKRRNLEKLYGHLYKRVDVWFCLYCGVQAECLDHVPPLVWMDSAGTDYFMCKGILPVLVPACLECNGALGSQGVFEISDRRATVASFLEQKYRHKLSIPYSAYDIYRQRVSFANQYDVPFNVVDSTLPRKQTWERISEPVVIRIPSTTVNSSIYNVEGDDDDDAEAVIKNFKLKVGV